MTVAAQTSWAPGTPWSCLCTIDLLTQGSEVSPRGHWPLAEEKAHRSVGPFPVDHTGRVRWALDSDAQR